MFWLYQLNVDKKKKKKHWFSVLCYIVVSIVELDKGYYLNCIYNQIIFSMKKQKVIIRTLILSSLQSRDSQGIYTYIYAIQTFYALLVVYFLQINLITHTQKVYLEISNSSPLENYSLYYITLRSTAKVYKQLTIVA